MEPLRKKGDQVTSGRVESLRRKREERTRSGKKRQRKSRECIEGLDGESGRLSFFQKAEGSRGRNLAKIYDREEANGTRGF